MLGLCGWLRGPRGELRWRDPDTGRDLEDYAEAQAGRAAAEDRAAEEAVTRGVADERAAGEAAARRAVEAENAELRAQLRRLRR